MAQNTYSGVNINRYQCETKRLVLYFCNNSNKCTLNAKRVNLINNSDHKEMEVTIKLISYEMV